MKKKCTKKVEIINSVDVDIEGIGICGDTNIHGVPQYCIDCGAKIFNIPVELVEKVRISREAEDLLNS